MEDRSRTMAVAVGQFTKTSWPRMSNGSLVRPSRAVSANAIAPVLCVVTMFNGAPIFSIEQILKVG
jgi:hypothetical protein